MILISLLLSNLLIAVTGTDTDTGYCDIATNTCENEIKDTNGKKQIFYDVNPPEGFNLRRDVYMRFAIMFSERYNRGNDNWELVLPSWHNLYHWKSNRDIQQPWSQFFDVDSLKSFAPVVEMHEVFSKTKKKVLEIDTLYILENYEDAFESGVFKEKWQIIGECKYKGRFWGYKNVTAKEVLCVKFQGKASKLWELISLHPHDKKVMFTHGEIPLHDDYGTKSYWDCRKSMKFNKNLVEIAKKYISQYLNCDSEQCKSYLSVHWRRQDFARSRGDDVPTILNTAKQIHEALKKLHTIKKVFIATDASMYELNKLGKELIKLGHKVYFFLPSTTIMDEYGEGGIAIIDQIICSHAAYFIGTHDSTFSYRIQEEREIMGFDSDTTFNRLCPDTGYCEKVSRWTIVN